MGNKFANGEFKTAFSESIFYHKYAQGHNDTWHNLAIRLDDDVCGTMGGKTNPIMSQDERDYLVEIIRTFKFIPGGRYLYYAGRAAHFWNNCYLLRAEEDSREEWAGLTSRSMSALMSGGGIGVDYSRLRAAGRVLSRTGGRASGPIPLMYAVNEIGRNVMQGGSRRSAIYASLNWQHPDVMTPDDHDIPGFLYAKDWHNMPIGKQKKEDGTPYSIWDAKQDDFNYHAPLDMTNISVNYDNAWLEEVFGLDAEDVESVYYSEGGLLDPIALPPVFLENVKQALRTAEPGFSFNFWDKENETLRNACTEVVSEDDSDVCNLGSINMGSIESLEEFKDVVRVASKFLVCGTLRADLPYEKVYQVRQKNRRLGLGLMGIHEWLLRRGEKYEVTEELHKWLEVYKTESEAAANEHCDRLYLSRPVAYRAIAPTGSIGILAATTTGIEPLLAVAYKRRYLKDKTRWHYQYVVDSTAEFLIQELGTKPDDIETALTLAEDYERRIKFQADIQDYVDMSISSTINLPAWGTKHNGEAMVEKFATTLASYAPRLRGFTCYPDGARGGQPLTAIPYEDAMKHKGVEFQEHDICDISGKGGTCGA
jgi:ribonucleoside-diphosphate reductase alpha chain